MVESLQSLMVLFITCHLVDYYYSLFYLVLENDVLLIWLGRITKDRHHNLIGR